MVVPWIDEFPVVTKYMNISRAARELAMSQSALSRHLKQMEQNLGFKVFELKGGRIQLTPSGVELADGLPDAFAPFQNLSDRCTEISRASFRTLTVQNPPYSDVVGEQYLSFLYNTINASGFIQNEFVTASRTAFIDRTLNRSIDVVRPHSRCSRTEGCPSTTSPKHRWESGCPKTTNGQVRSV